MPWTFVQAATVGAVTASQSLAYGSNVTAGDLLVVAVSTYGVDTVTPSDSQGNTYTRAAGYVTNPGNGTLSIWYAIAQTTGACTVTVALSANDFMGLGILDYTPPAGAVAVDGTAQATGGSTAPSCGSIAVAGAGELCIAAYLQETYSSVTVTAGSGFTLRCNQPNGASYEGLGVEDALNVSTAQTGSFTLNAAAQWAALGVSFKVTAGATPALIPRPLIVRPPLSPAVFE